MYDCVTSINDLSDNGKNFEFGYNSSSDSYGYYKDGVFTEFGGTMKPIEYLCLMASNLSVIEYIYDTPNSYNVYAWVQANAYVDKLDNDYIRINAYNSTNGAANLYHFYLKKPCVVYRAKTSTVTEYPAGSQIDWDYSTDANLFGFVFKS